MTLETLKTFCWQPGCGAYRPALLEPWSEGDHTFATNARILVCIPRQNEIPERENAPKKVYTDLMLPTEKAAGPALDFPGLPDPLPEETCSRCSGMGKIDSIQCLLCYGLGKQTPLQPIVCGKRTLDARWLRLIAALPAVRIYDVTGDDPAARLSPLLFRFNRDGLGLIMPLLMTDDEASD